jgi:hypothetical protein
VCDLGLGTGKEAYQVDRVAPDVHCCPTREIVAKTDVTGAQQRDAKVRFDVADRSQLAAVGDGFQSGGKRMVPVVKRLGEDTAGASCGLSHATGLLCVGREGLLAEDVLSRLEGLYAPFTMQPIRERVVDGFDVRVIEQGSVRGVDSRDPMLPGERAGPFWIPRRDGCYAHLGHAFRRSSERHGCNSGGAKDPDPHCGCVIHCRRGS